jgi:hypothetical protein
MGGQRSFAARHRGDGVAPEADPLSIRQFAVAGMLIHQAYLRRLNPICLFELKSGGRPASEDDREFGVFAVDEVAVLH